MTLSPGDITEDGWTAGYLAVWHERRGIQIKLAEGFNEGLKDDLGRSFCRSLYYEFEKSALKRIWLPCFISWEMFDFEYKGEPRVGQYMNVYCIPRDVAYLNFKRQYADIFGWSPADESVDRFWSDICAALEIFLQYPRDLYERSVPDPRPPRFIPFEWGRRVLNWQDDFPKMAASALELIQEARSG